MAGIQAKEGWLHCAAVLDAISRCILGWPIDSKQDVNLVVNALVMAISNRQPEPGGIVHAGHDTQFTSWVFGEKIRAAGLLDSFGPSVTGSTTRMDWNPTGGADQPVTYPCKSPQ